MTNIAMVLKITTNEKKSASQLLKLGIRVPILKFATLYIMEGIFG